MDRRPVVSTNLASVGYDDSTRTLEVEFQNGGVYQYFQVPRSVFEGLVGASSKGEYFHRFIRSRFRFEKVG